MPFSPKQPVRSLMRPCGLSRQHVIRLGGFSLVPDMSGALFMPEEQTLLVADLHLEQGASLARRGIHVPPFDTQATLAQLENVLVQTAARRLILLGDSFHDKTAHEQLDEAASHRLSAITSKTETIWISGNHDPLPPLGLGGSAIDELAIGPLLLRHIPGAVPEQSFEIAGHLHPGAAVHQRGHRIQAKCFVADERRMIMPAFGAYTGGLNVRSHAFRGLFAEEKTKVWMIGRAAIHSFPFNRVG